METDKVFLCRSLAFCPTIIRQGSLETHCTRCWEWLEVHEESFEMPDISDETDDDVYMWDLDEKKIKHINCKDIKSYSIANWHGMIYFK